MPADVTYIQPMTSDEARNSMSAIKGHLTSAETSLRAAREEALNFYSRSGWVALGYPNLEQCARAELGKSWQHFYRLKDARLIEKGIEAHSPTGESPVNESTPERHLRPLKALSSPEQQVKALDIAKSMAEAAKGTLTGALVERAVAQVSAEAEVKSSPYKPVALQLANGDMTAIEAQKMVRELRKLKPEAQAFILRQMTKHGLTCAALVPEIAAMYHRPAGNPSYTLRDMVQTGTLDGTPLKRATLADLARARKASQAEHIAEAEEKRRHLVQPKIVTVYQNDPARTLKALQEALPYHDLIALQRLIEAL